ncbi:unnamed protein product [Mytilus edulis]|uniref:DDE Tnp4 domain-containing protein n=1 Tax=Mytilus edulis TaxID=6550 RepID=A0A8S3QUQ9_MYTED|nr:unnamed protein product [Mytilus edulis]
MADHGFTISDLLALKGATLAIPPFAYGRQLSSRAVTRTRRIANARIHVERAIGDIKSFQLLQGTLPLTPKPILDDIIFVYGALCNLRSKLVKSVNLSCHEELDCDEDETYSIELEGKDASTSHVDLNESAVAERENGNDQQLQQVVYGEKRRREK